MRLSNRSFSILLLLACASTELAAQRPDSAQRADTAISRRRHQLPPVVVTGSLSKAAEHNGVTRFILDHTALRAEPSRAVIDPLRHATSVFIDEANGPNGPTIIRLRGGEETFTRVLVDGVQLNENGGFFDAQGLTLVGIDRVEVARGPQSALYGSSAMSGVVQLFTRPGDVGPVRAEALVEAGRATTYGNSLRASVEGSGGTERVRYSLGVGSSYDRGIYRVPNDLHAHDASGRADFLFSNAFALTALARWMDVESKLPVRDAGVTRAPLDPNQRQERNRRVASLQQTWAPSNRWAHKLSVAHYHRVFTYEDTKDGLDQTQFSQFVFDFNYHYASTVLRSTATYVGTVTGQPAQKVGASFSYGGEWERESLKDHQSGDFGPSSQSIARPSTAVFGEGQVRVSDRLSVLGGARMEKFSGLAATTVPRATVVLEALPGQLAVRASMSRAYKAPNIQDQYPSNPVIVANPDLKPETSRNIEGGVDFTGDRWNSTVSLTVFHQVYENLIRSVTYDASGRQINRNLGKSESRGLEAEVTLRPRARWATGLEATFLKTHIIDNAGTDPDGFPNGRELPFRPAYTASAFVDAPLTRSLSTVVRVSAIGHQIVFTDRFSGPRVPVAPYQLLSATVNWSMPPSMDSYLKLDNILNRTYETAYDRHGQHRTAAIGLRVRR